MAALISCSRPPAAPTMQTASANETALEATLVSDACCDMVRLWRQDLVVNAEAVAETMMEREAELNVAAIAANLSAADLVWTKLRRNLGLTGASHQQPVSLQQTFN